MTANLAIPQGDELTWTIRAELQRVDRELVKILAERIELVRGLWAYKRLAGLPLEDRDQEGRVLSRARATANQNGLKPTFAEEILRAVIAEGKREADEAPCETLRYRLPLGRLRSKG